MQSCISTPYWICFHDYCKENTQTHMMKFYTDSEGKLYSILCRSKRGNFILCSPSHDTETLPDVNIAKLSLWVNSEKDEKWRQLDFPFQGVFGHFDKNLYHMILNENIRENNVTLHIECCFFQNKERNNVIYISVHLDINFQCEQNIIIDGREFYAVHNTVLQIKPRIKERINIIKDIENAYRKEIMSILMISGLAHETNQTLNNVLFHFIWNTHEKTQWVVSKRIKGNAYASQLQKTPLIHEESVLSLFKILTLTVPYDSWCITSETCALFTLTKAFSSGFPLMGCIQKTLEYYLNIFRDRLNKSNFCLSLISCDVKDTHKEEWQKIQMEYRNWLNIENGSFLFLNRDDVCFFGGEKEHEFLSYDWFILYKRELIRMGQNNVSRIAICSKLEQNHIKLVGNQDIIPTIRVHNIRMFLDHYKCNVKSLKGDVQTSVVLNMEQVISLREILSFIDACNEYGDGIENLISIMFMLKDRKRLIESMFLNITKYLDQESHTPIKLWILQHIPYIMENVWRLTDSRIYCVFPPHIFSSIRDFLSTVHSQYSSINAMTMISPATHFSKNQI